MEAAQAPILLPGPAPCPPHRSSLGSLVPPGVLLSSSGWLCACHGWAPFQRTAVPSLLRDRAGEAFMTAPEERRAPLRPPANAIPHGGRCCVSQGCTGRCVGRVVLPDAIWASREGGGPGAGPVSSSPLGLSALPGGLEQLWELGPVCPESRAAGLVSGAHSSRNLLRVQGCCRRGGVLSWMPRTLGPQLLPSCPFLWGMSHQRASITSGSWCPCLALTCAPQPHWGVVLWVESRAGWARWAQAQDSPPPPRAGVLGCGWASCCLLGWASLGTSRAGPQDGWEGVLGKRWHAWAAGTLVALRA